jgi:hypothetical protein
MSVYSVLLLRILYCLCITVYVTLPLGMNPEKVFYLKTEAQFSFRNVLIKNKSDFNNCGIMFILNRFKCKSVRFSGLSFLEGGGGSAPVLGNVHNIYQTTRHYNSRNRDQSCSTLAIKIHLKVCVKNIIR